MRLAHKQSNNHLLSALSKADFTLLDAHLSSIRLDLHRPLEDANKAIRHVYFPDSAVVSVEESSVRVERRGVVIDMRPGAIGAGGDVQPSAPTIG